MNDVALWCHDDTRVAMLIYKLVAILEAKLSDELEVLVLWHYAHSHLLGISVAHL